MDLKESEIDLAFMHYLDEALMEIHKCSPMMNNRESIDIYRRCFHRAVHALLEVCN